MTIDLLENPVRVTWDLQGDGFAMRRPDVSVVRQRVLDAGVFFVTLEQTPLLHPDCGEVVEHLAAAGVRVLLTSDGTDPELARLPSVSGRAAAVYLRLQSFLSEKGPDFARLDHTVAAMRQAGVDPGLSLSPLRPGIDHLASILEFCRDREIPRFKLPNVRIDDNFRQFGARCLLRPADLERLRRDLSDSPPAVGDLELEIHDLFLWEILLPGANGARSEYGGCQAGNSLAHVRHDGVVFPCMTWPTPLGSLRELSFSQIWMSAARRRLRRKIAGTPSGCRDCSDYPICFGGCRGLSDVLGSEQGRDPMCGGARE